MVHHQLEHTSVHIHEYKLDPYVPIFGCCNGSGVHLNVTANEWESLRYGHTPSRLALQMPPLCHWWRLNKPQDNHRKQLVVPGQFAVPPSDPSHWGFLPDTDFEGTNMGIPAWKKSHLLSLPKELRLEIWKWTVTDPSVPELAVIIGRDGSDGYQYTDTGAVVPRVITWLQPGRNCPIGLGILRTNRFIYDEALPLLYKSVRFAPVDHGGIFPLFLDSLSPHARSLIRHIKLQVPRKVYDVDLFGDPAMPLFHWAITCAQIAKFDEQLKTVEVEGLWVTGSVNARVRRSIIHPLCKIKTKKIFGTNNDSGLEVLLAEAERQLQEKAALRKIQAEVDATAMAILDGSETKVEGSDEEGRRTLQDLLEQQRQAEGSEEEGRRTLQDLLEQRQRQAERSEEGRRTLQDLLEQRQQQDLKHNEEDKTTDDASTLVEDWDVISYSSGISTPRGRPPSYCSRRSSDSWTDAASTFAEARESLEEATCEEER